MNRSELGKLKGVIGHGFSIKRVAGKDTGERCIRVFVKRKLPPQEIAAQDMVPTEITVPEGTIKTDVIETGEVVAWVEAPPQPTQIDDPATHQKKYRPICGGISVCPTNFLLAGTIGLPLVYKDNIPCLLSNTHVIAPYWYQSQPGDPPGWDAKYGIHVGAKVRQPSITDGGLESDYVAELLAWTEIKLNQPNTIDAAIARVTVPAQAELLNLGKYTAIADAQLGDKVAKSGRTTGITTGEVEALDVTIQVQYPHGVATMEHEIAFSGGLSAAGDSGSAIVRQSDNTVLSLLFAGSPSITLGMPIKAVFDHFGLSLVPVGTDIKTALASIEGKYTIVWGWDNNTKIWAMYDPVDQAGSDLQLLWKGWGYWIKTTQDCMLNYGSYAIELPAGWNLIGWWAEA